MTTNTNGLHTASQTPVEDIMKIAYEGQDPLKRQYHPGYERYMDQLPILSDNDEFLKEKTAYSLAVIQKLAHELRDSLWITSKMPKHGEFARDIIALEPPAVTPDGFKEGSEIVVAKWGDQFSSPVHGHADGYIHEELLTGKMRITLYRMTAPDSNIVRPIRTDIYEGGQTLVTLYKKHDPADHFKRQTLIHSFTSIGESTSLHYLPEHTRDGRDNGFLVQHFDDWFPLTQTNTKRIGLYDTFELKIGDVLLVRSSNVPDFGDHYIVITGGKKLKPWGLRMEEIAIEAPQTEILDSYSPEDDFVLLKLDEVAKKKFHEFHAITIENGKVTFPEA